MSGVLFFVTLLIICACEVIFLTDSVCAFIVQRLESFGPVLQFGQIEQTYLGNFTSVYRKHLK